MLVGHFAAGMLAKRVEPAVSLGTAILAATLADVLWCLFLLAGIEHVEFAQGRRGAANYIQSFDVPFSHSLAMGFVWAAAFASIYIVLRRSRRVAFVLFVVVLSHWLLDATSGRMPLAPGVAREVGLTIWRSIPATLIVEGGFWAIAVAVYARATRAKGWVGAIAFWVPIPLLTLIWYNNIAGPPPPNPKTAPIASGVFFVLVVCWAYWVNRLRVARSASG